jgi:dipeptidyl aminopeptidase/acylaminoacyl peptidase
MRDFIHRICVVLMASACLVQDGCDRSTQSNAGTDSAGQSGDLAAERAAFKTHLLKRGPAPDLQTAYRPTWLDAQDAEDVVYPSGDLKLHAWLSKDPKDGKRHPAVIFLHGNFIFEPRQWTATEPFRDAGMIAMTPMVRGENGNPGDFEMFYSEVDDVIARIP